MIKTRVPILGLDKVGKEWRFFDLSDGQEHAVGYYYASKMEALADLERYARENWGWEGSSGL